MEDKNDAKIEKSNKSRMSDHVQVKAEPSTPTHQIQGASIEQFTKVSSIRCLKCYFFNILFRLICIFF